MKTVAEAAVVLGVSPATLSRWTAERKIAAIALPGGRGRRPIYRYRQEDLDAFLAARRRPARIAASRSRERLRREYPALVQRTRPTFSTASKGRA